MDSIKQEELSKAIYHYLFLSQTEVKCVTACASAVPMKINSNLKAMSARHDNSMILHETSHKDRWAGDIHCLAVGKALAVSWWVMYDLCVNSSGSAVCCSGSADIPFC